MNPKKQVKLKGYVIETFDGNAYCNFLTEAKNSKDALKMLLRNSIDFEKIVNPKKDLTITVKKSY